MTRFEAAKAVVTKTKSAVAEGHSRSKFADLERFYTLYHESSRDVLERQASQDSEDGA
jgi:hypothetical protein